MKYKFVITLIIILILIPVVTVKAGEINISISEKVEVTGEWITLGELAEIKGLSNSKQIHNLESIKLARTVAPGYKRVIPREQILLLIENAGFSLKTFNLQIPENVEAQTANKVITKDKIIGQAKNYIYNQVDYAKEKMIINPRYNLKDLTIPDGDYKLEFDLAGNRDYLGNISLQCQVFVDDSLYKKVYLNFEVKLIYDVYTAKRRIEKGERVKREDFQLERKELTRIQGDLINDFNNSLIKDGKIKITIPKGGILSSYYLYLPYIINYGDQLTAELKMGSITISTEVKAQQRGKKGDFIIVENIRSGKRFKARVINNNLVRVVE